MSTAEAPAASRTTIGLMAGEMPSPSAGSCRAPEESGRGESPYGSRLRHILVGEWVVQTGSVPVGFPIRGPTYTPDRGLVVHVQMLPTWPTTETPEVAIRHEYGLTAQLATTVSGHIGGVSVSNRTAKDSSYATKRRPTTPEPTHGCLRPCACRLRYKIPAHPESAHHPPKCPSRRAAAVGSSPT